MNLSPPPQTSLESIEGPIGLTAETVVDETKRESGGVRSEDEKQ